MYVSKMICAPLKKSPNWASQITKLLGLSTERPYSKAKTASSLKGELAISRRPFRQKSRLLQIRKFSFLRNCKTLLLQNLYQKVNLHWCKSRLIWKKFTYTGVFLIEKSTETHFLRNSFFLIRFLETPNPNLNLLMLTGHNQLLMRLQQWFQNIEKKYMFLFLIWSNIVHPTLIFNTQIIHRYINFICFLIYQHCMPMSECCSSNILPTDSYIKTFWKEIIN